MSNSQSSACLIHASRLPCTPRTLKHDVLTTTMLHCGSRISKLCRSPVTPPFNFPRRLLIKFEFSSLFQAKGLNTYDEESDEFLPWLERKARTKISSMLSIGKSAYGRSLFASENIRTGDCILKVPYSVEITPDNLLPKIRAILSDKIGTVSKLAIILLVERKMGQSSGWAPYICCLPQHGEIHSTIFWSEYELNMICQSSVYQETVNQKAKIEKDFAAVVPVIADRNYAPGEEVLINYGKFPNAMLLLDFGFTVPYNIHDQVQIQLSIPHDDNLREMKLELLQHLTPKIKDAVGFNCPEDTFIIKEVRSPRGKGKGLPQALRAFARLLCCNSSQELSDLAMEAAQIDGRLARRPLKDSRREFKAHKMLSSHITQLMQKYDTAIKSLPVNSPSMSNTFTLRRQMAHDLLTGELRVLKSASIWLNNYCAVLKSTSNCRSQWKNRI
ncbi:uncharacterized protein LOC105779833 isoform X4 [Gossypium raimondii]|uniref:uncharacterized protein LOC105779833 isoform X4 n=1 Tax=Gossypium raimondii TaxID=29730 RepID=UPI00227D65FD|nr:uncharacterized protein LOC105779833 isoform X4 [Gossypium raimondii]